MVSMLLKEVKIGNFTHNFKVFKIKMPFVGGTEQLSSGKAVYNGLWQMLNEGTVSSS